MCLRRGGTISSGQRIRMQRRACAVSGGEWRRDERKVVYDWEYFERA